MNRLKEIREGKKVNQMDLANMLNISQGTLSNWERNKFDIDNESLLRIADLFDVSVDYLLGRENQLKSELPSSMVGLMNLGNTIQTLRESVHLSRKDLAQRIGVTYHALSKYETNNREPDYETLRRIADYFEVTVDYLLGREDDQPKSEHRTHPQESKRPLSDDEGNLMVQRALKDTGLLDQDGSLSEEGAKVVSDFISKNADMLKKLINKDE